MSKRRDIAHHDELTHRLSILESLARTNLAYVQALAGRPRPIKDVAAKVDLRGPHATIVAVDEATNMDRSNGKRLAEEFSAKFWEDQCRLKDNQLKQTLEVKKLLADERATLAKRVAFLESACDEWAEKCKKDYDNMGAQIRTLQTGMDNWQKQSGTLQDLNAKLCTEKELWQARCNNALQKLSEISMDNTYNGIQVDCPDARYSLDLILKNFLDRKKKVVSARG